MNYSVLDADIGLDDTNTIDIERPTFHSDRPRCTGVALVRAPGEELRNEKESLGDGVRIDIYFGGIESTVRGD